MTEWQALFEQMNAAGLNDFSWLVQNPPYEDQPADPAVITDWAQAFDIHILKVFKTSPETAERDLEFKLAALELHGITGRSVPGLKSLDEKGHKKVKKQGRMHTMVSAGSKTDEGEGAPTDPVTMTEAREPVEVPERHAKVTLALGITKSLGSYEFARIDVGAEEFCSPDEKEATWAKLAKEVAAQLEKMAGEIDKYRAHKAKPAASLQEKKQAEGSATKDTRKALHTEIVLLAKQGLLVYDDAIKKVQQTVLEEDYAQQLIEQLRKNDLSFFHGVDNDAQEDDQIDRLDDDIRE